MPEQVDKTSILNEMSISYAALEEILTTLDKTQCSTEGVIPGWSIKDILAHIASWHHRLLTWLDAAIRNEEPTISGPDSVEEMDALNAQFYQANEFRPLSEVLTDLGTTHQHFTPTDLPGVIDRLGTVQYDPLNPVGRNVDLVFQARIPGYQVDDWQKAAYTDRIIYDAWDKQACLVPVSDWPMRALTREKFRPYHDREILQADAEGAARILATIDEQGPLSSLEFEDRARFGEVGSWYGSTRTKRILRSLWACGELVTHHRKGGRHYYDRPYRVIPAHHFALPPLVDEAAYYRWIIMRRYMAAGILRPTAEAAIWSACNEAPRRKLALAQLVEAV